MCVATEKKREKKSRRLACNYLIPDFHELSDFSTPDLVCHTVSFAAIASLVSHTLYEWSIKHFYLSTCFPFVHFYCVYHSSKRVVHPQLNPAYKLYRKFRFGMMCSGWIDIDISVINRQIVLAKSLYSSFTSLGPKADIT